MNLMRFFQRNHKDHEQVDRCARQVLRAAANNTAEIEAAASSPFLYARVQMHIKIQQTHGVRLSYWIPLSRVSAEAIPIMALVTGLTVTAMWSMSLAAPVNPAIVDEDIFFEAGGTGVDRIVLSDGTSLSREDIFSVIIEPESVR
jgi:hypothetical protein